MKFSNILRGTRAEKKVVLPTIEEKEFAILLRPLTGLEHEEANAQALERARSKGVTEPKLGDPIFDLAMMAAVLLHGCVDPESPPNARQPTFSSLEEILVGLHPEEIVFLHHSHEIWQHECSPSKGVVDDTNLLQVVREVAGPAGELNFMRLLPNMQVSCAISMARTLLPLLEAKSSPGKSSETTSTSNENPGQ